jgi:branched-chain amino acid transport system substrate-binding protein
MSIKKFSVNFSLFCIALIFISIITASPVMAKDSIRIGFSMAITGYLAPGAVSEMNAYKLWKDTVNDKGGIYIKNLGKKLPVEFIFYDDQSREETAIRIYEKLLTQDKVDLILTPYSTNIHFAISPLAEKYKVPMLCATAATVKLRDVASNYFWFISSCVPDRQMETLSELLKFLNVKDVAIIYMQHHYSKESCDFLRPALKRKNIKMTLVKDYPMGVKDLTSLLTEVKGKKPQALIALTYPGDSFLVTKQVQEVGCDVSFFFGLVGPAINAYGRAFSNSSEGITTMGCWSPKGPWAGAKKFNEDYIKKWNIKPDYLDSVVAYQECQVLEQAIEKAGTLDRKKIRDVIAKEEFDTINGKVRFEGKENVVTPSGILQYQKGELEIIWPEKIATSRPIFPKPPWPN